MFRTAFVALVATVGLGLLATAVQAAEPIDTDLLSSDAPKTVMIDPATGNVLSVTAGFPKISHRHTCQPKDACFRSGQVPYADQGFRGSAGMKTGNWPYRDGYFTGKRTRQP
ncbi:hypothetical protein GCM10010201_25760 [Pilimelia columellifera subsp. columellifera]|uniref:Uncharacterized protein n=1 Tax=Pilimelia columellifera subsp. columellifera TaxID=706583 RepID=A0ABN3NL74_9ACTN